MLCARSAIFHECLRSALIWVDSWVLRGSVLAHAGLLPWLVPHLNLVGLEQLIVSELNLDALRFLGHFLITLRHAQIISKGIAQALGADEPVEYVLALAGSYWNYVLLLQVFLLSGERRSLNLIVWASFSIVFGEIHIFHEIFIFYFNFKFYSIFELQIA
jgi:hypothetical protein